MQTVSQTLSGKCTCQYLKIVEVKYAINILLARKHYY